MADNFPLLSRIQAIMPDLKIEKIEKNAEGLINEVVIVNDQWVFRFAKTERSIKILENEMRILDLIGPRLTINVPQPVVRMSDCIAYPLLPGAPLSRLTLMQFDVQDQNRIAQQLGASMYELHAIDVSGVRDTIPSTRAPVRRADWLELQQKARDRIYPLLQKHQTEWADALFESVLADPNSSNDDLVLIHGDLASYHLLIDTPSRRLTGIIDFGMAGLGDPASDIGNLINIYGETFVSKMKPAYPDLDSLLTRARFYAQLIELEWILQGLETGETFWFTGHLATARDILA
jgi:aminoglycoside 2''-phosphotransferase